MLMYMTRITNFGIDTTDMVGTFINCMSGMSINCLTTVHVTPNMDAHTEVTTVFKSRGAADILACTVLTKFAFET